MANFLSVHPYVKNPPLFRDLGPLNFQTMAAIPVMRALPVGTIFGEASDVSLADGADLTLPFGTSDSNMNAVAVINATASAGPSRGIVQMAYGYPGVATEDVVEFELSSLYTTITLFTTETRDRIRFANLTGSDLAVTLFFGTAALRTPPIT